MEDDEKEQYVQLCVKLFEEYPHILKTHRDADYIRGRKNVMQYYHTLKKKIGDFQPAESKTSTEITTVANIKKKNPIELVSEPTVEQILIEQTPLISESCPNQSAAYSSEANQSTTNETPDLEARKMRLKLMLSRDDMSEEALKLLKKSKSFNIDKMTNDEIEAMESMVGTIITKDYCESGTDKLLDGVGRIIEFTLHKPAGSVSEVYKKDKLLKQDIQSLFGQYIISKSLSIRAAALFTFDTAIAILKPTHCAEPDAALSLQESQQDSNNRNQ